jgi:hypothetical protein
MQRRSAVGYIVAMTGGDGMALAHAPARVEAERARPFFRVKKDR